MDRATELRRLAQVLHRKPEELAYLNALDAEGLTKLRTLVQNGLIDHYRKLFEKMANAGRIVPDAISAVLCRKVFGPALTANLSYYVPPDRAAKLCKHFDGEFMAAVAREQVPERAKSLLGGLPVDLMRQVMRRMLATRDYHVMGEFLDQLPEDKAVGLAEEIREPIDYLRICGFAQNKERLARVAARLADDRLKPLIAEAFAHVEYMLDIGLVTAEMSAEEQRRMAKLTDEIDPQYRQKMKPVAEQTGFSERLTPYFAT
jgi:hypothetical protein